MKSAVLSNAFRIIGAIAPVAIVNPVLANAYQVIEIHDGDTISVVDTTDNSAIKVRLSCIDC